MPVWSLTISAPLVEGSGVPIAEADGNRTRPPGIARRTGFEDREGHQPPFASRVLGIVDRPEERELPPARRVGVRGRRYAPLTTHSAGAGAEGSAFRGPASSQVVMALDAQQHALSVQAR